MTSRKVGRTDIERPGRTSEFVLIGRERFGVMKGILGAVVATAILISCQDSAETYSMQMMHSVGDEVQVVRSEPSDLDAAPTGWHVEEVVRLGGKNPEDPAQSFGDVRGVELDDDGNVYVLDRQASTVRVFGADGVHLKDIGHPGEGPGEFHLPRGLHLGPDGRLWVADRSRYTVFDLSGEVVETLLRTSGGGGTQVATRHGSFYESAVFLIDPVERVADHVFLELVPEGGAMVVTDTIWRPAGIEAYWRVEFGPEGEGGMWPVPFATEFHDHPDPGGGFWRGATDGFRFVRFSAGGEAELAVERVGPRGALIEPSVRRDTIEALRETFGNRIQVDLSMMPEHLPLWSTFFVDVEGWLWVERFRSLDSDPLSPREWEIYDSSGVYLGVLQLPLESTPTPKIRNGRMVGTVSDSLGVQHVVLFGLDGTGR